MQAAQAPMVFWARHEKEITNDQDTQTSPTKQGKQKVLYISSVHVEYYMAQIVLHCQFRWVQPNLGAFTDSKLQVKGNTNFHSSPRHFFCYQDRQWILHLTKLGVKTKTVEIIYSDELELPRIEW
jgi:hypothetical protein